MRITQDGRAEGSAPGAIYVLKGPMVGLLRVWTEAEWTALSLAERPAHAEHFPGLGWVGLVPAASLN